MAVRTATFFIIVCPSWKSRLLVDDGWELVKLQCMRCKPLYDCDTAHCCISVDGATGTVRGNRQSWVTAPLDQVPWWADNHRMSGVWSVGLFMVGLVCALVLANLIRLPSTRQ